MTYATPLMQDRGERLPVAIGVPERGIMPCCTRVWGSALLCPRSSRTSDGMFAAALNAVSSLVAVLQPGALLLPNIGDLRSVVGDGRGGGRRIRGCRGLAGVELRDIVQPAQDAM